MGSHSLLQGIVPTQRSNPDLLNCRRILYQLSHQGSPRILEWVAYPFSRGSSQTRNWTEVSCIAGGFFTSWATREAPFSGGAVVKNLSASAGDAGDKVRSLGGKGPLAWEMAPHSSILACKIPGTAEPSVVHAIAESEATKRPTLGLFKLSCFTPARHPVAQSLMDRHQSAQPCYQSPCFQAPVEPPIS